MKYGSLEKHMFVWIGDAFPFNRCVGWRKKDLKNGTLEEHLSIWVRGWISFCNLFAKIMKKQYGALESLWMVCCLSYKTILVLGWKNNISLLLLWLEIC